jgi:ketosteroid isomerase-like protein
MYKTPSTNAQIGSQLRTPHLLAYSYIEMTDPNPKSTTNTQIIHSIYTAFSTGDIPAFTADISPNIVWTECTGFTAPGTFHSANEILEKMAGVLQRDWEGFTWELDYLIDGGEKIAAIGTYSGTNRETGKTFEARGMHVWEVRDSEIVGFEGVSDTWVMQNAAR